MLGALAEENVWGRKGLLAGRGPVGHQVPTGKPHSHFLTGPFRVWSGPQTCLVEESGILDAGLSAAGVAPGLSTEPWSLGLPRMHARTGCDRQPRPGFVWRAGGVGTDSGPEEFVSVLGTILSTGSLQCCDL